MEHIDLKAPSTHKETLHKVQTHIISWKSTFWRPLELITEFNVPYKKTKMAKSRQLFI